MITRAAHGEIERFAIVSDGPRHPRLWSEIRLAFTGRTPLSHLAAWWRKNESSLRGEGYSPSLNLLIRMSRRVVRDQRTGRRLDAVPDELLLDVLQSIAGTRAVVTLAAPAPSSVITPAELRALNADLHLETAGLHRDVETALADGHVDQAESAGLARRRSVVDRLLNGIVRVAQQCANGRSR